MSNDPAAARTRTALGRGPRIARDMGMGSSPEDARPDQVLLAAGRADGDAGW